MSERLEHAQQLEIKISDAQAYLERLNAEQSGGIGYYIA